MFYIKRWLFNMVWPFIAHELSGQLKRIESNSQDFQQRHRVFMDETVDFQRKSVKDANLQIEFYKEIVDLLKEMNRRLAG